MKALLITTMIVAGSLVASTGYSQVYFRAHVNVGIPAPQVYCAPAPAPAVYQDEYDPAYAPAPVIDEYPVETYYNYYPNYPAWGGHYRDRFYFDHYRPYFNRYRQDHSREFNRFREEHRGVEGRGFEDRGRDNRGYDNRGHENRGYDNRGHDNRGYDNRGSDRHDDRRR